MDCISLLAADGIKGGHGSDSQGDGSEHNSSSHHGGEKVLQGWGHGSFSHQWVGHHGSNSNSHSSNESLLLGVGTAIRTDGMWSISISIQCLPSNSLIDRIIPILSTYQNQAIIHSKAGAEDIKLRDRCTFVVYTATPLDLFANYPTAIPAQSQVLSTSGRDRRDEPAV